MITQKNYRSLGCGECLNAAELGFEITMAFQPIVNVVTGTIFAHEALVRGPNNEGAAAIFKLVTEENRYRFDQACRVKAVQLASRLQMPCLLSINFMPNAVYRPELCIRTTLEAARQFDFPVNRIIFEIVESEKVDDLSHLREIVQEYKAQGFLTAVDDFGAGHAGLTYLSDIQPDIVKLDMALIRNIDKHPRRQTIVKAMAQLCRDLSMQVIVEGIETVGERDTLLDLGLELMQGFFFARPAFETLASVPLETFSNH